MSYQHLTQIKMACLTPILIDDPSNLWLAGMPSKILVPCGHCIGCLKKKQNDWSIRIAEELKQHACNCFITLTYRDSSVPVSIDLSSGEVRLSLRKEDYQKFLKNLRRSLDYRGCPPVKFFVCGEYGSKSWRPHYHIVVCGASTDMCSVALDYWRERYGFVLSKDIGLTTRDKTAVGMYVGKYSSKGVFIESSPLMVDFIEKPFCEASHFLGIKYIQERIDYFALLNDTKVFSDFDSWVDDFVTNFRYNNNGWFYSMPVYYKDYFFNHLPSGLSQHILEKTGFDPFNEKIYYVTTSNEGCSSSKTRFFVPTFRNQIAISLYHLANEEYRRKCGIDTASHQGDLQNMFRLSAEELSNKDSFFESGIRSLDSFYQRSRL